MWSKPQGKHIGRQIFIYVEENYHMWFFYMRLWVIVFFKVTPSHSRTLLLAQKNKIQLKFFCSHCHVCHVYIRVNEQRRRRQQRQEHYCCCLVWFYLFKKIRFDCHPTRGLAIRCICNMKLLFCSFFLFFIFPIIKIIKWCVK